ncbi:TonB-dependent receptor [Pseudomaricurvus alkylphenolicus]|uniref:TonB-dependent receptor n=1 Tax=Pseudomaricurvus alkylphenolicus TaxID=1306991 RepID=UPI001424772F|nr:TonB-dependent receptor [Pseudomaricurvus alkylphenolicus]NIB44099.1 TonB-dependent receptor [Pseudomaricurvus alkylphenolicus]
MTSEDEVFFLEEIVVNARRVEESLQSVPVTVTALDSDALREATITSTTDIQQNVPGIFLGGSGGPQNPLYVIRGQSKGLIGTTSPAVVSYFAEVPQPAWGSAVPQFDMDSIQVLKGPQGTLFGRNTTGGAILYAPTAPDYELSGYLGATLGAHSQQRVQGALNIPLVEDKVALRVAGDIHQRDGYTDNIGVGGDLDAIDTELFRISLLTEFGGFSNTLIIDSFKSDNDGFNVFPTTVYEPSALNALGIIDQVKADVDLLQGYGKDTNNSSFDQREENERLTVINRTEFEIDDNLSILNIFGYQTTDLDYAPNIDGIRTYESPVVKAGLVAAGIPESLIVSAETSVVKARLIDQTKQFSNEIQLRGSSFDSRLDWIVGAFYLKSEPDGVGQINTTSVAQTKVETLIPGMETFFTDGGGQHFFLTDESKAVFVHGEYDLTDAISVELGIRYTEDDFELCLGSDAIPTWLDSDPGFFSESACRNNDTSLIVNSAVVEQSSNATTWSLGVNWQATEEVFAYAVLRHGYRAGGANGPIFGGTLESYQTFEPEEVDDLELGLKMDWQLAGMPVRTNISYFKGKYEKAQGDLAGGITTPSSCTEGVTLTPDGDCNAIDDPTGGALVLNVGDTSVEGVDLELVARLTERLTVSFNATIQDADIDKIYEQPNAFIESRISGAIPFLYFTNSVFQSNLSYAVNLGDFAEELVINANYYNTSAAVKGDTEIPSYDLTNLRADLYGVAGSAFDVSLFVNNVFDEEYAISSSISTRALGLDALVYGPPRLWGLEARYSF